MDYRIPIEAPSGLYYLQFKHLHGNIKPGPDGQPAYVSGGREYTKAQVMELLLHSTEPLPTSMLRGHRLATAAYVWWGHAPLDDYGAGVGVLREVGKVSKEVLRRGALSHTVDHLLRADRAYFHLHLSKLEGKDMVPLIHTALGGRHLTVHREILLAHLLRLPEYQDYHNMITQGYT